MPRDQHQEQTIVQAKKKRERERERETKSWLFKAINKTNKPLARLTKKRRNKTKISRNKRKHYN